MERVLRTDPYIVEQFQRYESVKKSWVQATDPTHIFSADLDDSISRGTHTVTVRAIDEFGRVHHGHSILEITGGMRGTDRSEILARIKLSWLLVSPCKIGASAANIAI